MNAHWLPVACLFCALGSTAAAAPAAAEKPGFEPVEKGEFPGIRLMPPGSKPEGIRLQRYVEHRLAVLLNLQSLEVLDRSHVAAEKLHAVLYDERGDKTSIRTENAVYSFLDDTVRSASRTSIENPRFRATGTGITAQTKKGRCFLQGPVRMEIASPNRRKTSPPAAEEAAAASSLPSQP